MKCIKCSYTSFDFNQACPKCGKELSAETEKLHLPPYKPNPPYLLTSFTGETGGFEHSMGNEPSGVSSFLENQNEEIFMLDKNRLDSSENLRESSLNDGENELMVALDELSFEYEPAMEHGSKTPESPMSEDLFMPEISSQKEKASSTESVLFDTQITEDASPFAPIDEEESYSGIFDKIETPGASKNSESYLELDLSDINQVENQPEEDELLISLDDLSFDQEPVPSKDFLEREPADEHVLSVSEVLDFDEKNSQGQSQNLEDYIKLDLSDEENAPQGAIEMPELFSNQEVKRATDSNKGGKKKTDLKNDFIDLDLLEMEVDKEGS